MKDRAPTFVIRKLRSREYLSLVEQGGVTTAMWGNDPESCKTFPSKYAAKQCVQFYRLQSVVVEFLIRKNAKSEVSAAV